MKIIIIGAGEEENGNFIKNELNTADYTIAVDGGLQAFYHLKKIPDIVIGDFDSVDKDTLEYFRYKTNIRQLPVEKDDSDLEIAVKHALNLNPHQVILLQFLGKRIDHLIVNLYQLFYAPNVIRVLSPTKKIFALSPQKINKINEPVNTTLSLLPFSTKVIGVTAEGLRYPLKNRTILQNSLTLSNIIANPNAAIYFESGKLLAYIDYQKT